MNAAKNKIVIIPTRVRLFDLPMSPSCIAQLPLAEKLIASINYAERYKRPAAARACSQRLVDITPGPQKYLLVGVAIRLHTLRPFITPKLLAEYTGSMARSIDIRKAREIFQGFYSRQSVPVAADPINFRAAFRDEEGIAEQAAMKTQADLKEEAIGRFVSFMQSRDSASAKREAMLSGLDAYDRLAAFAKISAGICTPDYFEWEYKAIVDNNWLPADLLRKRYALPSTHLRYDKTCLVWAPPERALAWQFKSTKKIHIAPMDDLLLMCGMDKQWLDAVSPRLLYYLMDYAVSGPYRDETLIALENAKIFADRAGIGQDAVKAKAMRLYGELMQNGQLHMQARARDAALVVSVFLPDEGTLLFNAKLCELEHCINNAEYKEANSVAKETMQIQFSGRASALTVLYNEACNHGKYELAGFIAKYGDLGIYASHSVISAMRGMHLSFRA